MSASIFIFSIFLHLSSEAYCLRRELNDSIDSIACSLQSLNISLKETSEKEKISTFAKFFATESYDSIKWIQKYRKALGIMESNHNGEKESLLIPFLTASLQSGKLGEADKMRAEFKLEEAMKNRPGTKPSDFEFKTIFGKTSTLYETLTGKATLLIFYDPDCSHCMEIINTVRAKKHLESMQVIAIDIAEDEKRWMETAADLPKEWFAGYAGPALEDEGIYIFNHTPTLFILNPDGTVAVKNARIADLPTQTGSTAIP